MNNDKALPEVRPWIRFWARWLDLWVFSIPALTLLWPLETALGSGPTPVLDALFLVLAWPFVEALFISRGRRTPGKWLLRTRIEAFDGQPIGYARALNRSFKVAAFGMGAGLPFVTQIANFVAYDRLRHNSETYWDRTGRFVVRHERIGRVRGAAACALLAVIPLANMVATGSLLPEPRATAVVDDFGVYFPNRDAKPSSENGYFRQYMLAEATERIVAKPGRRFGLRFHPLVSAEDAARRQMTFTTVWRFPPPGLQDNPRSTPRTRSNSVVLARDNDLVPCIYRFEHEWEQVPGRWRVEVWQGDRLLIAQEFVVVLEDDGPITRL